jgi:hypothetical protein
MRATHYIWSQNRQRRDAGNRMRWRMALFTLVLAMVFGSEAGAAQNLTLSTAPGGLIIGGGAGAYNAAFGTMNGLGAGTSGTGVTVIPLSNGALYYTPFRMTASGMTGSHTGTVTAYVSTNFAHIAAATMDSCPSNSSCNSSGQYSALSLLVASPTTVGVAGMANNVAVTGGLAIFVPDNDGASAFAGLNTVTITFKLTESVNGNTSTVKLALTATTQTAVQLTLQSAPGGATINPGGTTDYALGFGNVNALGIGPGAGFTTTLVAGGIIYDTPILINPAFAEFTSTTASVSVYVSRDFAHPAILSLQGALASAGPYVAISKNVGAQTQATTTGADRSSLTGYLGLFVSNVNGATAYTGSDSATLTFTMTVP